MNSILFSLRRYFRHYLLYILSINYKPKPGVHILNGHFLSLNDEENPEIFDKLLRGLINNGVVLINFEDAVKKITSKEHTRICEVALTFDDGFEECFTKIKPVLDKYNTKAAFFINPNFIDGDRAYQKNFKDNVVLVDKNPMTWDQVLTLSTEGHVIGAHTLDHIDMNSEDEDMLTNQVKGAKEVIEARIEKRCLHFAFPFGRLENISELGVRISKQYFDFVYSQSNYKNYFSFNGLVINRRHFECNWPLRHVLYFLKDKTF